MRPVRMEAYKLKEEALCRAFVKIAEVFNHKARKLRPLYVGFVRWCLLHNQSATNLRKSDRSGIVMEVLAICGKN